MSGAEHVPPFLRVSGHPGLEVRHTAAEGGQAPPPAHPPGGCQQQGDQEEVKVCQMSNFKVV